MVAVNPFFDRDEPYDDGTPQVEDFSEMPEGTLGKMFHNLEIQTRKEHILEELITRPLDDGSITLPTYCKLYDSCYSCIGKCDLWRK